MSANTCRHMLTTRDTCTRLKLFRSLNDQAAKLEQFEHEHHTTAGNPLTGAEAKEHKRLLEAWHQALFDLWHSERPNSD